MGALDHRVFEFVVTIDGGHHSTVEGTHMFVGMSGELQIRDVQGTVIAIPRGGWSQCDRGQQVRIDHET